MPQSENELGPDTEHRAHPCADGIGVPDRFEEEDFHSACLASGCEQRPIAVGAASRGDAVVLAERLAHPRSMKDPCADRGEAGRRDVVVDECGRAGPVLGAKEARE